MNNEDIKHLDLLAMFHYVFGGIHAFFSCIPFVHVFMGLAIVSGSFFGETKGNPPPPAIGWIFVFMGSTFILVGWTTALLTILAGRKIKAHKSRMFCMVVAGIECMFMPFGTVLGVFTLVVLNKDSVRKIFEHPDSPIDDDTPPKSKLQPWNPQINADKPIEMKILKIPVDKIKDWPTFHKVFTEILGFPKAYGENMDAWIDCMTSIDKPDDGTTNVHVPKGDFLILDLGNCKDFATRCPAQYDAILGSTAFVNSRRIENDEEPVLSLSFNRKK